MGDGDIMKEMREDLIAPCGMNCRLCLGYQREKKPCGGCRMEPDILYATKGSRSCVIKNCPTIQINKSKLCFECDKFPCRRLKDLDKRYTTKYRMSMLENLATIRDQGMDALLQQQEERWICKKCGSVLCVHREACPGCKAID
jgi:hypothetical protein